MNLGLLNAVLQRLHNDSLDVESSALISSDGMTLVSNLRKGVNPDHIGAMSAGLLSLGDRMISNLSGDTTDRVMVQSHVGYVIITSVTSDLLLTVVVNPDARLGMVFHDIKTAVQSAKEVVEG